MSARTSLSDLRDAPDRPVMEAPWSYEVAEFHLVNPEAADEPTFVDLVLRKGHTLRRLRFEGVRGLAITPEFWYPHIGLEILDVQDRGWEDIGICVNSFEAGELRFWARSVIDLDTRSE